MESHRGSSKCAATCCAKLGVSLSCLLFQQPAYPPKHGTLLHPAFFAVPVALATATMAHGVLCSRHRTKHLLQEKHWEITAFWNSAVLKPLQLLSRKVQRVPALKSTRKGSLERRNTVSLKFLCESFPLGLTQHWALLHSPEHLPAHTSHCPRQHAQSSGHPDGSTQGL